MEEKTVVVGQGLKRLRKETMIFPRYHQLDAVRALCTHAQVHGAGHNYLIQHSAGSGKSNSIAWLAHRLSSLHDAKDEKIFHSVVVITDRRVLDKQLQDTIFQFEHKLGVVQKIDENTQQLAKALADGVPVIISTIKKFPFISQAVRTLEGKGHTVEIDTAGKRFAEPGEVGQPILAGATATFECRLATAILWETHHIIVGRATSVRLSDNSSGLLYGQRAYRKAIHLTTDI